MEEFYGFCAMVRDEGSNCLAYVQEADRTHVQADYRREELMSDHLHPPIRRRGKGGVAGRKVRAIERGRAPIEMSEDDQTTQYSQAVSNYEPTNIENVMYITPQTPQYQGTQVFHHLKMYLVVINLNILTMPQTLWMVMSWRMRIKVQTNVVNHR